MNVVALGKLVSAVPAKKVLPLASKTMARESPCGAVPLQSLANKVDHGFWREKSPRTRMLTALPLPLSPLMYTTFGSYRSARMAPVRSLPLGKKFIFGTPMDTQLAPWSADRNTPCNCNGELEMSME